MSFLFQNCSSTPKRPNILFAIADDWSWPHASCTGNKVLQTPTFDRLAQEGVLFNHAFVSAPSCTPSRGVILTGQYHWRLEEGGNLWSTLPTKFPVYPDLLAQAGYHVGFTRKGWGPGKLQPGGREQNPAGPHYENFDSFLAKRPVNVPFCFWFGSYDPHRPYQWESGVKSGMNPADVDVPPFLPDNEIVRKDLCDYYWEVQRFDKEVGELLEKLEAIGELENTFIVMTGDNGMPFPRCKSNLYDYGTNVPLAIRWGKEIQGGRTIEDFIHLSDLAPTFLGIAGLKPPECMTGRSFLNILTSSKSGWLDPEREQIFTGKERHAWVREGGLGYPCRAVRTRDFLYIRNFEPDRWPAGDPESGEMYDPLRRYGDIDGSPTIDYMLENQNLASVKPLLELAVAKRPAEELYDLIKDPWQLTNVADQPEYTSEKAKLAEILLSELTRTGDPRVIGNAELFDHYPYYGGKNAEKLYPGLK
ncbi:sulfatase [candidate division KSB1 bacterium]|nr:sulfatase [candidate division KSB1 bacterium]